ncbi:Na+/H+ antiporter NhaA [Streptomyces sp. NRRL B-24720]|uniref:Na+/H+ antiporter NhaA n=1 Tax=Streptomyces sp. NRRL B-24720 TaxID=1476876 RepID=UPI0004C79B5D|nr:Na+/H+ antiporter NhaA [Streptomyces sp. NRRL B-24720]
MTHAPSSPQPFQEQSTRDPETRTPLRAFLATESGSAAVLLAATVAALVWANVAPVGYASFWETHLSVTLGSAGVSLDLREWVNSGLMTFFFFVIGLEARREFDTGELRERQRVMLPLAAGLAGMIVPVAIYLAFNAGDASAHGWGAAMSTDTAFALGMLAILGRRFPDALRTFILTVTVVDDLLALVVIAFVYSDDITVPALLAAVALFGLILLVRAAGVRRGVAYLLMGVATWVALLKSGVDPVVVGLAMGLLTYAYPAARSDLERASDLFISFREQPTPELERSARQGLASAVSLNERLQQMYHPWTSYVIVPLFALANAGITVDAGLLSRAATSPITLGILLGYVVGKPVGITGASWLLARLSRGRLRPPVGWGALAGGGTIAGVGFTVALLISTLAFEGDRLEEAKMGILSAVICSFLATCAVATAIRFLSPHRRARVLLGTAERVIDLAVPVDPARDHVRGPKNAPVTLVEYADFECPFCGQAEPVVRDLLADFGDLRYVWRHLPLTDVHPSAQLAAEAAEAAAEQGAFWEMHDRLLEHQGALQVSDLKRYADELGLDAKRFQRSLRTHAGAGRVAEHMESADLSGVSGTPTFFINGLLHRGAYDIGALSAAVRTARARAGLRR